MHIHILGICGTFMGGVAQLACEAGHKVTGCDAHVYPPMSDALRNAGIEIMEGYDVSQLDAVRPDVFVIGNAISRGNPLLEAILNRGLSYTSGPAWLCEHVLAGRHVLAVAGTHGKTTTTSMLAWILKEAGPALRVARPSRPDVALRHRGRRIRHGLLRQAEQVRALSSQNGDPQQS